MKSRVTVENLLGRRSIVDRFEDEEELHEAPRDWDEMKVEFHKFKEEFEATWPIKMSQ